MIELSPMAAHENSAHQDSNSANIPFRQSWAGRSVFFFIGDGRGRYLAAFLGLGLAALAMRLWDLSGRTMHYDEAIHLYYSWRLSNFEGFIHSPWMHGPFQIELVATFLRLLGDSDFVARLAYVIFGTVLVILPFFLRNHLGRAGAFITGLLLAVSPSLLYFSRFGRNDIIMAVLTVSLFMLLWHYCHNPRNRFLYISAALLAIAFASKETAYIVAAIFGALALLLAIPFTRERVRQDRADADSGGEAFQEGGSSHTQHFPSEPEIARSNGVANPLKRAWAGLRVLWTAPAAGLLVLLVTLTLPQWSAGVELAREVGIKLAGLVFDEAAVTDFNHSLGLDLVGREGVSQGIVGAPLWEAPFVQLPLYSFPAWLVGGITLMLLAGLVWYVWRLGTSLEQRVVGVVLPVVSVAAVFLAMVAPIGHGLDILSALCLMAAAVAGFIYLHFSWKHSLLLIFLPLLSSLVFSALFLPTIQVDSLLAGLLPEGIQVESNGNAVPLNFLLAAAVILATTTISLVVGILWRGGVWLACAGIFYAVWATLFTTFFTNPAGIFSGVWQGMGYWIAQQEVARGNQPWYYYFVGMSVYEFLPAIFGIIGAIIFIRRRDRLGMALAFWAFVNLLAYTVASEKMPWLLVNITVPFIFLAGKLLGEMVERVPWRRLLVDPQLPVTGALLVAPQLTIIFGLTAALLLTGEGNWSVYLGMTAVASTLISALTTAWFARKSGLTDGPPLVGLGIASLLLAFTVWTAFQAAYTFDDSRREILVYAQGSKDLLTSHRELNENYFERQIDSEWSFPPRVDYDIWYPFQWYTRHEEKEGNLTFGCFKDEGGTGGCNALTSDVESSAVLVAAHNNPSTPGSMTGYSQSGPRRNLLWFPETYRRPGENRQEENPAEEITQDLLYFRKAATTAENWHDVLSYLILRKLEADWFNSEYYTYQRNNTGH